MYVIDVARILAAPESWTAHRSGRAGRHCHRSRHLTHGAAAGDDDTAAIPDDIQEVLDEYLVVWKTHDYEALQELVTDDFRHVIYQGVFEEIPDRDVRTIEMQAWMGRVEPPANLRIEQVGAPIVRGEGPWYVSIAENWDGSVPGIRHAYISTYVVVVDSDGELRIDDIYSAWQVVNLEDG